MKFLPLLLSILAAIVIGLLWIPALAAQKEILVSIAFGCAVALIAVIAAGLRGSGQTGKTAVSPVPAAPRTERLDTPERDGIEAIGLLSALQEHGRLIDFLMDDITSYPDTQVGAAARIVHQGCRTVLEQSFSISPATESAEGATISVPVSYRGDEYRLSGSLTGQPPFTGTIVHPGWKTLSVKLPRIVVPDGQLPNIAPTEVEVKG